MFGDIGHGAIIFLAALYMILAERRLAKSDLGEVCFIVICFALRRLNHVNRLLANFSCMWFSFLFLIVEVIKALFSSGRYIILLMGAFSIYTGFMYNDIFSKSLHLWPSAWSFPVTNGTQVGILNENRYPFGLDPGWHGSDNALVFANSYKMKMSIVLGVIHVSNLLDRPNMFVNVICGMLDDVCPMFTSPQPPQIQTLFGFIHQFHSPNHFLAIHFRIPCSMHPLQMVC